MGKHSLSQILLSVVFKDLAELNSREDFGQKNIKMERNLCHLLIAAQPFRTCPSQEEGTCPISIDPKTQGQDVSLWSRPDRLCLHMQSVFLMVAGMRQSEFYRGSPQEWCWLQDASSTSDLGGKWEGSCCKSSLIYVVSS